MNEQTIFKILKKEKEYQAGLPIILLGLAVCVIALGIYYIYSDSPIVIQTEFGSYKSYSTPLFIANLILGNIGLAILNAGYRKNTYTHYLSRKLYAIYPVRVTEVVKYERKVDVRLEYQRADGKWAAEVVRADICRAIPSDYEVRLNDFGYVVLMGNKITKQHWYKFIPESVSMSWD